MLRFGYELQGRLLTAATLGLLIGGGAYASTVDEATFWYVTVPDATFSCILQNLQSIK